MANGQLDLFKHADKIRKSWNAGQKTIIIEGRRFIIRLQKRQWKNPQTQQMHDERWLTVRPADGGLTPCASIEYKHHGNLRSVR